jgi:hypothetical protein
MEIIVLFFVASASACAPVAFIRHALYHDAQEPWWFTPACLLLMAVLIVLVGGVSLMDGIAFPLVLAQVISVLIVGWGGWILLALRRG